MTKRLFDALIALWIAILVVPAGLAADVPPEAVQACNALRRADFSQNREAPTRIWGPFTKLVEAAADVPAYCQVTGYVGSNVGFELRLPAVSWNGKLLEIGCGGECGYIQAAACKGPLQKGYACIATDTGHRGQGGLWAVDDLQAQIDFAYRAVHVTAVAGKAITEHYYKKQPSKSYFFGCSTGGRQALVEAQRFPWDFDGIIAGAPWINDTDSAMNALWAERALLGEDGNPVLTGVDLQLVHDAVLAKCDRDDGVSDGLIGNPLRCQFDPRELLCSAQKASGCLSAKQVEAVAMVYDGPRTSKGEKIYPGGAVRGSEKNWIDDGSGTGYVTADGGPAENVDSSMMFFRFMVIPPAGPGWQPKSFDFDRDYKRFGGGAQESLLNAANPDLRKFKAAGGKLLIYQGWNDDSVVPPMTVDYYETVKRTMGGRAATDDFLRLFLIPGMLHCGAGDGAFAIDYLGALEAWVERGQPPEMLLAARPKEIVDSDYVSYAPIIRRFPLDPTAVAFTRPVYPYPRMAKYKGTGDPNAAVNFVPVESQ